MKHTLSVQGDTAKVAFRGDVIEGLDALFSQVVQGVAQPNVVIDCRGIGLFNSLGIKSWCSFTKQLAAKAKVSYHGCSTTMIGLGLVVKGVFKGGKVATVRVAHRCVACGASGETEVDGGTLAGADDYGDFKCNECGKSGCRAEMPFEEVQFVLTNAL